ncbi:MAG: hypothetical protein HZB16_17815 [Armatimonadetes bacterium]|nr:hypothetical protein [Armatimonadota bacterium]
MNQRTRAIRSLFEPRQVSRARAFAIAQPEFERLGFGDFSVPVATYTWGRWWVRRGQGGRFDRMAEVMVDAFTGEVLSVRAYERDRPITDGDLHGEQGAR